MITSGSSSLGTADWGLLFQWKKPPSFYTSPQAGPKGEAAALGGRPLPLLSLQPKVPGSCTALPRLCPALQEGAVGGWQRTQCDVWIHFPKAGTPKSATRGTCVHS